MWAGVTTQPFKLGTQLHLKGENYVFPYVVRLTIKKTSKRMKGCYAPQYYYRV